MGTLFRTPAAVSSHQHLSSRKYISHNGRRSRRSKAEGGSQWPTQGIHCRMEKDQGVGGGGAQEAEGEAGKEERKQRKLKKRRRSLKKLKPQGKKCLKPRRLELEQTRRSLLLVEPVEMPAEK